MLFFIIAYVGVGFYALIAQTLYVRELLVVLFGNELVIGVVLGAWLAGVAGGSYVGGLFVDRLKRPARVFVMLIYLLVLVAPVCLVLVRLLRLWADVPVGQLMAARKILLGAFVCELPTSLIIGMLFPIGARAMQKSAGAKSSVSAMYVAEAIGSVAGGLLFTFVLVSRVGGFTCIFGAGAFLIGCLGLAALHERGWRESHSRFAFAFACVWLLVSVSLAVFVENRTSAARARTLSDAPLVREINTPYQHAALYRGDLQWALYVSGDVTETFPDTFGVDADAAVVLAQHPRPEKILVVGGGAGGLVQKMARYPVVKSVELLQTDRRLFNMVRDALDEDLRKALDNKKIKLRFDDPRRFAKNAPRGNYDMVFLNLGDPKTLLDNRLRTVEYLCELALVLKRDGVLAFRVSATDTYLDADLGRYLALTLNTVRAIFPNVIIMPAGGSFVFASRADGVVTTDAELLGARYASFGAEPAGLRDYYGTCWPAPQAKYLREKIASTVSDEMNTDLHPRAFFRYLKIWGGIEGGGLRKLFAIVDRLKFAHVWIVVAASAGLLAAWLVVRRPRAENVVRLSCLGAIVTTGFAGFAYEIILLTTYQTMAGHLYERIALFVSAFMAGLALGAVLMKKILAHYRPSLRGSMIIMILMELVVLSAGFALLQPTQARIFAITAWVGFLVGAEFPLGVYIYRIAAKSLARTAANIDAADHCGAIAGAVLTATFMIPAFGLFGAAMVGSILNALTAAGLIVAVLFQTRKLS